MATTVERWRRMSAAWAEACWASTEKPHRAPILAALETLQPADSLLEVGCNAGPNLRLIHARWPQMELGGADVQDAALDYLEAWMPAPWWIYRGDVRDTVPAMRRDRWDIVLSCYCLTYLEPDELPGILAHLQGIARVGIVIAEPMTAGDEPYQYETPLPEWKHNYRRCFGAGWDVTVTPLVPPVDRLNGILTARKVP